MGTRMQRTARVVIALGLMLGLLTGCGRAFGAFQIVEEPVTQTEVTGPLRFAEGLETGPVYEFSMVVPEEWVSRFVVRNNGNTATFVYMQSPDRPAPIFTVQALSARQFWEQVGSYPGQYQDLIFTGDTYFIYSLPLDAFYSGLPREEYAALAEQVRAAVTSFSITLAN